MEQNKLHTPDIVILLETKNRSYRYAYLKKRLGMDFMHAVEPRGIAGGMCIFWRTYDLVMLVNYSEFFIEVGISDKIKDEEWRLVAIYASTDDKKRRDQWHILSQRLGVVGEKCVVIGDFNDILEESEKEGGNYRSVASRKDFRDFVSGNELLDLGFTGYPFTWRNQREDGPIQQRLDRGLASEGWISTYPEAKVLHEVVEGSDHAMLILDTDFVSVKRRKRFIYDSRWNRENECHGIVGTNWKYNFVGSKAFRVVEKLKWVRKGLQKWSRASGRNSQLRIAILKNDLRNTYKSDKFASEAVRNMEGELKHLLREEERYWKLKSRNQWMKEGDKNTKFFHAQTMKRRRCNKIVGLEDEQGNWCTGPGEVDEIAVRYFRNLFRTCNPRGTKEITECVEAQIRPEKAHWLMQTITAEEVRSSMFQIPADKAPGPDGFTGSFYHEFWEVVGSDIVAMVQAFWASGKMVWSGCYRRKGFVSFQI
ncbi:hypothetical protein ACFX1W_033092 [Malus domestica]